MDCSICSGMPYILRPPRNTICGACYEGARAIITLSNSDKSSDKPTSTSNPLFQLNSTKGLASALKWVKEMKETEDELNEKIKYFISFSAAFHEQIHTDIQVHPGNDEPPIPAHRALLAARSSVFRDILECKAPPNERIRLPELTHEELQSLLEFLYSGDLPKEKAEKHVYSLSMAADKYEIPFLQKFCEQQMVGSLCSSTALDVLEVSDTCSNQTLKEIALNYIVRNMEEIVFSPRFDRFALRNPHLTVQITRASFMGIRKVTENLSISKN